MTKYLSILTLVSTSILASPSDDIKTTDELNKVREVAYQKILKQLLSSPSLKNQYDNCIKSTNRVLLARAEGKPMNHQLISIPIKTSNCFTISYSDISNIQTLDGSSIQISSAQDVLMTSISMEYISKGYNSTIVGTGKNQTPITQIKLTF